MKFYMSTQWIHVYCYYLIPPWSAVKLPSVDRSAVRKRLRTPDLQYIKPLKILVETLDKNQFSNFYVLILFLKLTWSINFSLTTLLYNYERVHEQFLLHACMKSSKTHKILKNGRPIFLYPELISIES